MAKKHKRGTFVHGIAASEHIDSSGERIKIAGVDISSLTKDGIFNFEHQSKDTKHIVGKILEATKILKLTDCKNEHHKKFWHKVKMPFIYVAGELFDGVGHEAAEDVAAMLRYDNTIDKRKTKRLINFSIEGSRLGKEGSNITKCIARKVSITITPCNKVCEAEEMTNPEGTEKTKKSVIDKILGKSEENICELVKDEKYSNTLAFKLKPRKSPKADFKPQTPSAGTKPKVGTGIKPKRTFTPEKAPKNMKIGDRIDYTKRPKPKTGQQIYNDPDTFKSKEIKKFGGDINRPRKKVNLVGDKVSPEYHQARSGKQLKPEEAKKLKQKFPRKHPKNDKYISNMRKALMAGSGFGSPATKTGMSALGKEEMVKVCKSISEDNWATFGKKEQIVDFLTKRLPNCTEKEIMSLAKTVAYMHEKKKEQKLIEVISA